MNGIVTAAAPAPPTAAVVRIQFLLEGSAGTEDTEAALGVLLV